MQTVGFLFSETIEPQMRAGIVPRDYQIEAHDQTFMLWDMGETGVLIRLATGLGKTLTASLISNTWLRRGDNYRIMVVSYETQLVYQFSQEIEDYLGITPAIEMGSEAVGYDDDPHIVVASRQSLLRTAPATPEQLAELAKFDIWEVGALHKRAADKYLRYLRKGGDRDEIIDQLRALNDKPEAANGAWCRLHKFNPKLNWLVIFDEAHRHARKLQSVGHIAAWFEQNPLHRRLGLTATPKRGDGVSIGDSMFPGIAIDLPLFSPHKACAVRQGWAVPYVQQYIEVEGVDFRQIKRVTEGGDFDEAELEKILAEEAQLAKLVTPLLEKVGKRRTLIFSPGVEMAKKVANFINARRPAKCECGLERWYPLALIGDGAVCDCGRLIGKEQITADGDQARALDGSIPHNDRRDVYRGHRSGKFQFLSVCGLCREGYNDPDIACVAVFRPVSKEASSLAEQMKGRGCRPLRKIACMLHQLPDAEARVRTIAESEKPNCLIIDLVGITGLADCASTVDIYAEGLPDEVRERAEAIVAKAGLKGDVKIEEAIEQAKLESEEAKARARRERQEAERKAKEEAEARAKADAQAQYTTHDVGYGSNNGPAEASDGQLRFIRFLGMNLDNHMMSRGKAGRIINQLRKRTPLEEIARTNRIPEDQWRREPASMKQLDFMRYKGLPTERVRCGFDASLLLDAMLAPDKLLAKKLDEINKARNSEDLDALAFDLQLVRGVLREDYWQQLVSAGKDKRQIFTTVSKHDEDF
jgi:superfamily II DNA or RNA helicase